MAKVKTTFYCQNCGSQFAKWQGQCSSCKSWNTIVEEIVQKESKSQWIEDAIEVRKKASPKRIAEIEAETDARLKTYDGEFNRVTGGGLVQGSVTLLGGEPGIGKSTLLLQIALRLPVKTLYVSGEESQQQIKLRAERVYPESENCFILNETNTQQIFNHIKQLEPEILIVDSIQTLHTDYIDSTAGSVSQIKACTAELIQFAKQTNVPVLLIGHITKEGQIAGPKILEHMVDTVLQFEGERNHAFRVLRANKNRFGSTNELGIYEMKGSGLHGIENPAEVLISKKDGELSGNAIAVTLEGMRPLLVEVQALVSSAVYGTPQRSTTGFNAKRLNMLLAVLEKRAGFRLGSKDVFLNITGGISVDDPAIDLAVVAAILSSNSDESIPSTSCFAGEIGLSGEIRPVNRIEQRIREAEKLGFQKIYISKFNTLDHTNFGIDIILLASIDKLLV
ncbi:MAG: DNA repair protein RadA [Flavobacteriaceae bacterium]|nr:DNA repair protein RadA [Bacteroidia bacterium]NNK88731.1 DNA repair protein RadA [Flavobacteriaceae bacterium]